MVIMDNYYPDQLEYVWRKIEQLHYSYLEIEDSPKKIEIRAELEARIRDFLCHASHDQKFVLHETAEVLYRSANIRKDFSAYKASTGFNAIQLYAGNLLAQPWRKEYRTIKMYSGFYVHQIEAHLVGAELMFEAMGYKQQGVGVLVLDGPICPDRVIAVSKDCLIAYIECQILKQIWEEVTPTLKTSWIEILEYRKTHVCSPEKFVEAVNVITGQRSKNEFNRAYSDTNGTSLRNHPPLHYLPNACPHNQTFPPLLHRHVGLPPPVSYYYGMNGCNNYGDYGNNVCLDQNTIKPHFNSNGYYYTNGYMPSSSLYNNYGVPTGQLIELDGHGLCETDSRNIKTAVNSNCDLLHRSNKDLDRDDMSLENWKYVYEKLDRDEKLDARARSNEKLKIKDNRKSIDGINSLSSSSKSLKPSPKERKRSEKSISPASSYDNISPSEIKKSIIPKSSNITSKPKSSIKERSGLSNIVSKSIGRLSESAEKHKPPKESNSQFHTWACKACTYLNDPISDICEMCSKSRSNVEQPMEVGGPECPHCTLVNPKEAKSCEVCKHDLTNSPTYI